MTEGARFKWKVGGAGLILAGTALAVLWSTLTWKASIRDLTRTHETIARTGGLLTRSLDAEMVARIVATNPAETPDRAGLQRGIRDLREARQIAAELGRLPPAEASPSDVILIQSLIDQEDRIFSKAFETGDRSAILAALGAFDRAGIDASLRTAILRLETMERVLLAQRSGEQVRRESLTEWLFALRGVLAAALVLGIGWQVFARFRAHEKSKQMLAVSEAQYRQVVEVAGEMIYRTNEQGRLTFCNRSALATLHYSESELLGRSSLKLIRKPQRGEVKRFYLRQIARRQKSTYYEFPLVDGHGRERWVGQNAQLLLDENKKVIGFQAIAREITERKRAEIELRKSQNLIERIAATTPGILYVHDLETRRNVFCNSAIRSVLGYAPDDMAQFDEFAKRIVHPDDLRTVFAHYDSLRYALDGEVRRLEYRARHADGQWIWLSGRETAFERGDSGLVKQVVGISQDVTARKAAQEKLAWQASYDSLTKLLNRQTFTVQLQNALRTSGMENNRISVCLFDLDFFKEINDVYGHATGDEVLEEVGNVVRAELRAEDICGRLGGDEFCIAFPGTLAIEAMRVAERIRNRLGTLAFGMNSGTTFSVTATFGIAESRPDATVRALLEAADRALYRAKYAGRNRVSTDVEA